MPINSNPNSPSFGWPVDPDQLDQRLDHQVEASEAQGLGKASEDDVRAMAAQVAAEAGVAFLMDDEGNVEWVNDDSSPPDLTIKAAVARALDDWLSGTGMTRPDAAFVEVCEDNIDWLVAEAIDEWKAEHGLLTDEEEGDDGARPTAMADRFTVFTCHGATVAQGVDLDEAARLAGLAPEDVFWAIDNYGRCDSADATVLPEGESWTELKPEDLVS